MFLHKLPIMGENHTFLTHSPHSLTCAYNQTHQFFLPNCQSRRSLHLHSRYMCCVSASSGSRPSPEEFPVELRRELMPKHIALTMDGNRRWAKKKGLTLVAGYEAGVDSMMRIIDLSLSWGIEVLTLFWISCDNWKRPEKEFDILMELSESTMSSFVETYNGKGIKISVIGDTSKLPESLQRMVSNAEEKTKQNTGMQLILALNYSGRYDVIQACKAIARKIKYDVIQVEDISKGLIEQELETKCSEFPNPDLMIRTSGELRISNFLLWQIAHTELVFDPHLWPDYGKDQFLEALTLFQQRQRRFGGQ